MHANQGTKTNETQLFPWIRLRSTVCMLAKSLDNRMGALSADLTSEVLQKIPLSFDQSCDHWRGLYIAALEQFDLHNKVITDAARPQEEK